MLRVCSVGGTQLDCCAMSRQVLTDLGSCFVFSLDDTKLNQTQPGIFNGSVLFVDLTLASIQKELRICYRKINAKLCQINALLWVESKEKYLFDGQYHGTQQIGNVTTVVSFYSPRKGASRKGAFFN